MRIGRMAINVLLGGAAQKQGATPSAAGPRTRRTI
jgi:hypothetical protein